ncbi:hypothetical protein SAY87_002875 [Trapa incisa]|uniref:Uncharacterized protein n=1 Tax=Trapa incisa TaxID=236973 RepID=A0AAN7QHC3_9MYRT|nr:hypothetical protein SAY87_002875 [Trapa incisa]
MVEMEIGKICIIFLIQLREALSFFAPHHHLASVYAIKVKPECFTESGAKNFEDCDGSTLLVSVQGG